MKSKLLLFVYPFFFLFNTMYSQTYCDGKFTVRSYTMNNGTLNYTLYDFSREGNVLKAKYFAQNAFKQYNDWKSEKKIMFIVPGAFSDSWKSNAKPVGLCVDNGVIVNRGLNSVMDGMVIVYNGSTQAGGVAVVDLSQKPVSVRVNYENEKTESYYLRKSNESIGEFLNWGEREKVTLFQSQLVYSCDKTTNFKNLNYGEKRERRFLALCKKNGIVHHVVVDAPNDLELNLAAQNTKTVLEYDGFTVMYILNLDTGDKNLMYCYNGSYLEDKKPYRGKNSDRAKIEMATNLLVYYMD